ncbi:MAG: hypothetical protein ABF969_13325 [Sporolactobacillus sp.]
MGKDSNRLNDRLATLIIYFTWLIMIADIVLTAFIWSQGKNGLAIISGMIVAVGLAINLFLSYHVRSRDRKRMDL